MSGPQSLYRTAQSAYCNGDAQHALTIYQELQNIYPYNTSLIYNVGLSHRALGDFVNAQKSFEKTLQLDPTNNNARNKLLQEHLRNKEWQQAHALGLQPYWWHNKPIKNKTVLITYDGGFGDVFMFLRYAQELHNSGAHVTMQTPHYLQKLLTHCPYVDQLIDSKRSVPQADYTFRVSIPELTLTMAPILDEPYLKIPYLFVPQERIDHWQREVAKYDVHKKKIGLCWQASFIYNPITKKTMAGPRGIPFNAFVPLLERDDCIFFSLQKGVGTKQITSYNNIVTFDETFDRDQGSFVDTAALMKNLDLVITTDTSIAHLAGALGVEVWVIVPKSSDFRWFLGTNKTPWYPTMTLFRQSKVGEWDEVVKKFSTKMFCLSKTP
jgi:hypothetical protein